MIFKFLEKPLIIKAFLSEQYSFVPDLYPVSPSHKFIPPHWKNTTKSTFNWQTFERATTVRSCSGIIGTFTNGHIMPLWSDLALQTDGEKWRSFFSDNRSNISDHSNNQFKNFYENYIFLKIDSPWLFYSNMDYSVACIDPFYTQNKPKPYIVPYGVMQSINKYMSTNFFIFLKKERNDILIKAGTPMIHMLFLTDKKVKIDLEVLSASEYNKRHSVIGGGLSSNLTNRRGKYLEHLKKWSK